MLTEPGLNTLQSRELADRIEEAVGPLRERIQELESKVERLEQQIPSSESWRF
jgi:hypothetical protein